MTFAADCKEPMSRQVSRVRIHQFTNGVLFATLWTAEFALAAQVIPTFWTRNIGSLPWLVANPGHNDKCNAATDETHEHQGDVAERFVHSHEC